MNRLYTLLWAAFALLGGNCTAQNLVPNPGLEGHGTCPTNTTHFLGYVNTWLQATTASPDYVACGYTGNSYIRVLPATGNGAVGMWGGAGHPSCPGTAYSEGIRTNLSSPMVSGKNYHVSFRVRVDPTGSSTRAPNDCMDFGMYFYNSASPPPMTGWCCNPVTPQWRISGSSIPQGPYAYFDQIVAGEGWDAVIIGPFCNGNTANAPCTNYEFGRMYFNLDDVSIEEIIVLTDAEIDLKGKAYAEHNALRWEVETGHPFERFVLERSVDAENFSLIAEQFVTLPGQEVYHFQDLHPEEGANYYRLTGTDETGAQTMAEVVELRHGANDPRGGALHFAYQPAAENLHFSLETGTPGPHRLEIIDLHGRVVQQANWQLVASKNEMDLPVAGLAQGMYLLRMTALQQPTEWTAKWIR